MPMPAPLLSSFAPSLSGGFALFGRRDSDVVIPTYTNAQKLSLSPATAVGTQVKVSDGFVVSGAGSAVANGLFYQTEIYSGKPLYRKGDGTHDGDATILWETGDGLWYFLDAFNGGTKYTSTDDVAFPWLIASWSHNTNGASGALPLPTLTHPAVQQLAAPSSAQGGVFVSGGTQDGIFYKGVTTTTVNGKIAFWLLGHGENDSWSAIWSTDVNSDTGQGPSSAGFIVQSGDFGFLYYSLSNVATPDLASNWKNASDDSPASITVTSVTGGQVAAGMKFGSDFYAVTTPVNGRNAYHDVLGVAPDFTFNGSIWTDGTHNGTGNTAFPWNVTGITITQDNVASETNWTNV